MSQITTKDFLSEAELHAIERFLADETAVEAVRKVILSGVYFDGRLLEGKPADPLKNFILGAVTRPGDSLLPDAEMGAKVKAIVNAVALVESGFKELEKCIPGKVVEDKEITNPAV